MKSNIQLQPNGYDCGIFVINYMQQLSNYVRKEPSFQLDSHEERLNLALKLLKSDLNEEKETLYDEAARWHHEQVENEKVSCGIKRKGVHFDTGAKKSNVGLKTGYKLPTTHLVGKEVQRHTQQIWEWVMKDEVSIIGIWGMAGVGKTSLATHVHNKLLEDTGDDFDHVIWITMSQDHNRIYKLQKAVARSINVDISDECDITRISGKLLQAFEYINRCVLILDNVWEPIILEEVGFPVSNKVIKLILTTRSWEVCQSMNCMKNIIDVKPLDEEDGWDLFKSTVGIHQIQSSGVELIAKDVANQCGGLPLAIVTIARSMKGKEHIREWNFLLECLQNLDNGQYDMEERVFSVLKFSYACLNNKLQRFLLYYALSAKEYVEDTSVEKYVEDGYTERLIRRFFYEGWTGDEPKSIEMQYNEGYTMLNKLNNNSLLIKENWYWRMHTLLRVMAIDFAKKAGEIMAKPCMKLVEVPKNGEWKENLEKVFLTGNKIQKIPDGTSPKCSKISTLLLDCNDDLESIPHIFFSNMPALKILDLSKTGIKQLPESVSNLECLIALLLSQCEELIYVPSLAKLQRLIELDLSFTAINETPSGLELLVNLLRLNLEGATQLKMSTSVISKMTNLRSLWLMNSNPKSMDASAQNLQGLEKLEVISVNFCNTEEFNAYVKGLKGKDHVLKNYFLSLATLFDSASYARALESYPLKRVVLCGIDLANRATILPEDINELFISKCELKDLKQIVAPFAPSLGSPYRYLRDLDVLECSKMKMLIMPDLLAQLQNLETISVGFCDSMEEIVGNHYCSGNTFNPTITLPKVRSVKLYCLPELTFVFKGTMLCPSLKYFHAYICEKLSPPHIEIVEGRKLQMENISIGVYCWNYGN
ncbi:disease resistance protein At4g27190-like [Neltuma alba]|uniref:disease resistance protein At4g27190-like n=1 Tax=Neltuma alba TaxID=207710 RepID=UPI0010A4C0BB|nr:disease resistance protein At4g27190-like [Prosopis alba]